MEKGNPRLSPLYNEIREIGKMPVISREKYFINGEEIVKITRVLKDGLFRIDLPDYVQEKLGVADVSHETRIGADTLYKEVVQNYLDAKTTLKKVILYKFKMNGFVMGPASHGEFFIPGEDDPDQEICLFKRGDFHFDRGMVVGVMARVYMEERNEREDGDIFWHYETVDSDDDLPWGILDKLAPHRQDRAPEDGRMDWTPQRHAFFVGLHKAMSELILKIETLTKQNKLLEAINKNKMISI
jgi:hypothetical protein